MVYKKNCCWYNLELRKYLIWYHTENRTSRETTGCPEKKKKNKTKNLKHFIRWGLRSILESVLPRIFNNDLDTKWKLLMKYKYNTKLRSTGTAKEGKKSYNQERTKLLLRNNFIALLFYVWSHSLKNYRIKFWSVWQPISRKHQKE